MTDQLLRYGEVTTEVTMEVSAGTPVKTLVETPVKVSEKTSEKILQAILENAEITIAVLADRIGIATRSVERNIRKFRTPDQEDFALIRKCVPAGRHENSAALQCRG